MSRASEAPAVRAFASDPYPKRGVWPREGPLGPQEALPALPLCCCTRHVAQLA